MTSHDGIHPDGQGSHHVSRVRTFINRDQLNRDAAEAVVEVCAVAIAARGQATLALSGGSTPRALYQLLTTPEFRARLDWPRIEFFWSDERAVPPDDDESNFRMANETLLQPLEITPQQIHRLLGESTDLRQAAEDYEREIAANLAPAEQGSPPEFDLILLGMGTDGHTASLFPGTAALQESQRWVVANPVPQLQTQRLTMTAPLINQARRVMFLVSGEDKADRLAEVLQGPHDPMRLPSQLIQPGHGQLTWFIDQAAAARLSS